jgi:SAM-dependent methyltransferase
MFGAQSLKNIISLASPLRHFGLAAFRARRQAARFDREHGVDTAGILSQRVLAVPSPSAPHAIRYRPTTPGAFKQMMTAIPTDLSRFSFVDFGSGKGRVLLLASHLPFREVIGVEFSAKLHRIAERNIASYRATKPILSKPRAVEADATKFDLPNGPLVLYFYNPFGAPILQQVLRRAEVHPAPIFAVYNHPVWRKLFDRSERWREVNRRATSWVNFERI